MAATRRLSHLLRFAAPLLVRARLLRLAQPHDHPTPQSNVHRTPCPLRFQLSRRLLRARRTGRPARKIATCPQWPCSIATASTARRVFIWPRKKPTSARTSAPKSHRPTDWRYPLLAESREGYQNLCRLITRMKLRAPKRRRRTSPRTSSREYACRPRLPYRRRRRPAGACARNRRNRRSHANACSNSANFSAATMFMSNCSATSTATKKRATRPPSSSRANLRFRCSPPTASRYASRSSANCSTSSPASAITARSTTAGRLLARNSERHLKSPAEMAQLFRRSSRSHRQHAELSSRLEFTLEDLGYEFPRYPVPTARRRCIFLRAAHLRRNASDRYGVRTTRTARASRSSASWR